MRHARWQDGARGGTGRCSGRILAGKHSFFSGKGKSVDVAQIDPSADARWLAFLEQAPDAPVFCHPVWLQLLRETYNYVPICLAATQAESIVGVLPLMEVRSWLTGIRAVCLPFADACGAIIRDDGALRPLLESAKEIATRRGWRYVEVRSPVALDGFGIGSHYKLHRVALGADAEAVVKKFNQLSRRKLKQAVKAGVVVERRRDDEAVRAFIRLNALTRRKHGVPPQPDRFFWNLQRKILEAGLGFVGVATLAGRIVACAVFLHWKNTVVYKYGASDDRALSAAANYAVMWDAMRWACENGFTVFDLGRTDLESDGLLQFKRGWGSQESDLMYQRHGEGLTARESSGMMRYCRPMIARMPLSVLKLVGRTLYGHIG